MLQWWIQALCIALYMSCARAWLNHTNEIFDRILDLKAMVV